ncbi:MAG: hypothetical protein EAZ55_07065 [Cytophagales bacterium]|nr:MAG: hypothetical protein EAZ55_07065 [Cytophagales bacterium]
MPKEIHILLTCADARDISQFHIEAVNEIIQEFWDERRITVELEVIRSPGSFVSADTIMDIKRVIEQNQRESRADHKSMNFYVHIQTHGELEKHPEEVEGHTYNVEVCKGSSLNCGMLGATGVGIELEKLILENKPTAMIEGKAIQIDSEEKIRLMMRTIYAYDGYLAGDWIRSIDDLRTHARTQRAILERTVQEDLDLHTLNIQITAGIQDYSAHSLIRLDGGEPKVAFWDAVQMRIKQKIKQGDQKHNEILIRQSEVQKPLAGLLSTPELDISPHLWVAAYYLKYRGLAAQDIYMPNMLFNLAGSSFDIPYGPFGRYIIAGFYYGVKHLGLTDQLVLGRDEAQTARILKKIKNDFLMTFIADYFKVNFIPINATDEFRTPMVT